MMKFRMLGILVLVVLASMTAFGQQITCACDAAPGRTCHGEVKCPDGCTSLCGPGDACYLSCSSNTFEARITAKLVQKTGQEIAAELSAQSHQRIEFAPFPRKAGARYNLELKNDDLFNALKYLYNRGKVRYAGKDFSEVIKMRKELKDGKRISVNFTTAPVRDVVARLAFFSGERLEIKAGDAEQKVSVSLQDATLDQIIREISEKGHVTIRR